MVEKVDDDQVEGEEIKEKKVDVEEIEEKKRRKKNQKRSKSRRTRSKGRNEIQRRITSDKIYSDIEKNGDILNTKKKMIILGQQATTITATRIQENYFKNHKKISKTKRIKRKAVNERKKARRLINLQQ